LAECLQSVTDYALNDESFTIETVVVDNASTDDSVTVVQQRFPWVKLIKNQENVGFASANNQAIRQSQGRYILLLNSDAQLVPGAVTNMIRFLESNPKAGIASVPIASPDGTPRFCFGNFPNLYRELRTLFGLHKWNLSCFDSMTLPRRVDWVSGACLMIRRNTLDAIGLLDESFFMFGEEVDLCYRAAQAGWENCLVPSSPVLHIGAGSTGGKTSPRILRLYRGKLQYAEKHLGRFQANLLSFMIRTSIYTKLITYTILSGIWSDYHSKRQLWWQILRSYQTRGYLR
jgi:GT2 family glycosyltransferase